MGRIVIWIVGLAVLSIIYVATIHFKADDIEYELKDRSKLALITNGFSWANVSVNGRDAILKGTAPDIASVEKAKEVIMSVWGIRTVDCRCKVSQQTSQAQSASPIEPAPKNLAEEDLAKTEALDASKEPFLEREEKVEKTEIKIYNSSDQCQKDIDKLLADHSIEFASGSSTVSRESFSLLDKLVTITKACPAKFIKISGHTDNRGDADKNNILSLDRASAVLDYFHKKEIPVSQLKAVGHGESSPIDSNSTEEGRKRNRRIEFHITP